MELNDKQSRLMDRMYQLVRSAQAASATGDLEGDHAWYVGVEEMHILGSMPLPYALRSTPREEIMGLRVHKVSEHSHLALAKITLI